MNAPLRLAVLLLISGIVSQAVDDTRPNAVAPRVTTQLETSLAFAPPLNLSAGGTPFSVAVGDFNLDGNSDIAVANNASNDVSVLLGHGDGTFNPAVEYPAGVSPFSVRVGDFNRDGKPDLAVANGPLLSPTGSVSVLLGNGDGTFQPAVQYPTQAGSTSLVVADFNGDGRQDLATTNYTRGLSVLLGRGDGTFSNAVEYGAGMNPYFLAAGDFNRDGNVDLVAANNLGNDVSVLLGNGDGSFKTPVNYDVGTNPHGVAVGDFNGDGLLDLVAVNLTTNNISVLLGSGDGAFRSAVNYGIGPQPIFVAVEDLNSDGRPDLLIVQFGGDEVSVLLGNGDGTFQPPLNYKVGHNPRPVAVADFNNDGRSDLAAGNEGGNNASVLIASAQNPPGRPRITMLRDAQNATQTVVPGEWVSLYGANLATTTRSWEASDFSGESLPTALSGVSVSFNDAQAPVAFISPAQLNVQVPSVAAGPISITVTKQDLASASFSATSF